MAVEYYAQRLLNPFRGCIQVIRHQAAEAISMDGMRWDIYVSNDSLLEGLKPQPGKVQISDIRYGSWTTDTGLKRGPLYPSEDFYRMEAMGVVVYEYLLRLHDQVPFPLHDRYELWLTTADGRPLVLIHSGMTLQDTQGPAPDSWQIGLAVQEHFHSTAVPGPDAGKQLMDYVNGLAERATWFHRDEDGSGTPLADDVAATLPASCFPPLLLRTDGHPDAYAELIADFLAWQSPWLLLLPGLDQEIRSRLEGQARNQPFEIERHWRMYPAVENPELIQAARVEAMLSRRLAAQGTEGDAALSTFYIELEPRGMP